MYARLRSVLVCLLFALLTGCTGGTSPDEVAIRACYDGYRQAILDQDGMKAVAFVDESTLDYYRRMRDLALRGNRETVDALSTLDKLMVLSIRHRIPLGSLEQMTPESLFTHAVDEGWIGKESVINNELGAIAVSGAHATGVHISGGKKSPFKWPFRKEDDQWKVDIASIMPVADQAMEQLIEQSGLPEDRFLTTILESVSGKKVADTVWEPMTK